MSQHYLSFIALFLMALQLSAAEFTQSDEELAKQKIAQAIELFKQTDRKSWAYKLTRYENEEGDVTSSIEQFFPKKNEQEQWLLIKQNGKKPTKKQIKKFLKNKHKNKNKNNNGNVSIDLGKIVNQQSLELLSEQENTLEMRFSVTLDKLGLDSEEVLQGKLTYNKSHQFIEQITIVNLSEFSPMFSATISKLVVTFSFAKIDQAILPTEHKMVLKGRFALFSEIDEYSTDTYSNYQYQGVM